MSIDLPPYGDEAFAVSISGGIRSSTEFINQHMEEMAANFAKNSGLDARVPVMVVESVPSLEGITTKIRFERRRVVPEIERSLSETTLNHIRRRFETLLTDMRMLRNDHGRAFAIVITQLELAYAYFKTFVFFEGENNDSGQH